MLHTHILLGSHKEAGSPAREIILVAERADLILMKHIKFVYRIGEGALVALVDVDTVTDTVTNTDELLLQTLAQTVAKILRSRSDCNL